MEKPRKLSEIADLISAHLTRFENDKRVNVNAHDPKYPRPYYYAGARAPRGARYVYVTYVSFQGTSKLTREQAEAYLAWLDAGNVGTHYTFEQRNG